MHTWSWSVFAQGTVPIFTRTRLTLGARYSHDTKDYLYSDYNSALPGNPLKPVAATGCAPLTNINGTCFGKKSWGDISFRASIDHQLTSDVLLFASFNRGFQSGAFNVTVPNATPVNPVTVDAYEAGIKSELFGRRARLNISAFYYNYKNLQARANINNQVLVFNAASSKVKGVDVDFEARVAHGFSIRASAEILDAYYENFTGFVKLVPRPTGGNVSAGVQDVSGSPLVRSPKFTGNIGPVFTFPIGFGEITLNANLSHNSGFDWEPGGALHQPSYDVLNAGISWESPDQKWRVAVSGTNLTDATYFLKGGRASTNDSYVPAAPRMFMGTITRHF
jgi:iron complex outermembrane receptor protein